MSSPRNVFLNNFPGPRLAGVAFVAAPLLLLVGAALLMEFEGAEFETIQQRLAAQPLRAEMGVSIFIAGWLFGTICVFSLARLIAQRHPTLAAFAGFVALMGITVSMVFAGIGAFENGIAQFADRAAAAQVNELVTPPVILFVLLPGIPLGWVLLAFGCYRARVFGPLRAACVAGPALVPVGAIGGFPIALPIAFALLSIALVPLGIELLRTGATERNASTTAPSD